MNGVTFHSAGCRSGLLVAGLTSLALVVGLASQYLLLTGRRDASSDPIPTKPAPIIVHRSNEMNSLSGSDRATGRALLLSLTGARADFMEPYIADGTMRNLALLASNGLITEYVNGVEPPSPTVSHISLACGSRPRATGIVGEKIHLPGQPLERPANAAGIRPAVLPIWAWSDNEHETDALLFWPGGQGEAAAGAEVVLNFAEALSPSARVEIQLTEASSLPMGLPASYTPPLFGKMDIESLSGRPLASISLIALDTFDDNTAQYDSLAILADAMPFRTPLILTPDQWGTLFVSDDVFAGLSLKLIDLHPTSGGTWYALLYRSALVPVVSIPADLGQSLLEQLGPPEPPPDLAGLRRADLTSGEYLEMAVRHTRWKADAIAFVLENYAPRLTLAALDLIEQTYHALQPAGAIQLYDPKLRSAYLAVDQAVGRLLTLLDLSETTVMIGSPHGFAMTHTAVDIRTLLSESQSNSTLTWMIYSDGGAAHVFINRMGRETNGIIGGLQADKLIAASIKKLREFTIADQPAFQRVVPFSELGELGLDSPWSGDVFIQARPGILLAEAGQADAAGMTWPAAVPAAGYRANEPEMQGLFVMAGRRIPNLGLVGPVELVDLAPTLAEILGIERPNGIEGRPLLELLSDQIAPNSLMP